MKICSKCDANGINNTDKFCYKCGAKLIETDYCVCGYQFHKIDSFCPMCGKGKLLFAWKEKTISGKGKLSFEELKEEEETDRAKERI